MAWEPSQQRRPQTAAHCASSLLFSISLQETRSLEAATINLERVAALLFFFWSIFHLFRFFPARATTGQLIFPAGGDE